MTAKAKPWIDKLNLIKHPEGGYYSEVYRSKHLLNPKSMPAGFPEKRNLLSSIYFLLDYPNYSAFHRIKSDELWFHHYGDSLLVHVIHADGKYEKLQLGQNNEDGESLQHTVPAGAWFATELKAGGDFGLVSCVVSPGFDFEDFELAGQELLKDFPQHSQLIKRLLVNPIKKA